MSEDDARCLSGQVSAAPITPSPHIRTAMGPSPGRCLPSYEERHTPLLEQVTRGPEKGFWSLLVPCLFSMVWTARPPLRGKRGGGLVGGIPRLPSPQESGPSQDEARPTWNRSSTCIRGQKPGLTELLISQHRPGDPTTPLPVVAQPRRKPTCSVLRRPGVPPHQVLFQNRVLFRDRSF